MDNRAAAREIEAIVQGELEDCERAIKRDDKVKALRELDYAIDKLKRVATDLQRS